MPKGIYLHKEHSQTETTKKKIGLSNSIKLKGRKLSDTHRKNISDGAKGKIVSLNTREKLRKVNKGKHRSILTEFKKGYTVPEERKIKIRNKLKGTRMGSESSNWKGGLTPLNESIRHSFQYRQWRSDVFTRDNFICQSCGYSKGRILVAHHKEEFSKIIQEYNIKTLEDAITCEFLWNINNGITLCKGCHKEIHKK